MTDFAVLGFTLEDMWRSAKQPVEQTVEPVDPLDSRFRSFGARAFLVHNVLSEPECSFIISQLSTGLEPFSSAGSEYRRCDRLSVRAPAISELIWSRLSGVRDMLRVHMREDGGQSSEGSEAFGTCPDEIRLPYGKEGIWRPKQLNEVLRFCRYVPGGFFRAHCDSGLEVDSDEESLYTVMVYLDTDFEGGATRFLEPDTPLGDTIKSNAPASQVISTVRAPVGSCIVFYMPGFLHEGEELVSGVKHILRTDMLFQRDADSKPERTEKEEDAWRHLGIAQRAEAEKEFDKAIVHYKAAFKLEPRLEKLA
mmetsp:Transcript_9962/g.21933  ORF Transcript_9962/g.21933 Transcript_9962/m.21933 type:complete len:309 (+) Transcript_9962:64-990(+)|eukprot:CAMPEP_0204276270 /NCGR_PEP_ID=MMETSP0468-20130131/27741_1 /ASSEMBLY_ACC=CAM_ASM_000383 /TAXON_ID=2969 /ORGANISM="Oxyrrhis marina" /LENGTH=308 /DNA_ID=CAMNT_0051252837 /DNA_START=58 /DNA_END=984 /DNA_ORIENTATION=+